MISPVIIGLVSGGFDFVDAPVSGGIAAANGATLTFMVGGDDAAFAAALKPVFLAQAEQELVRLGRKRTDSAISLLSGLHRKDVRALGEDERRLLASWLAGAHFGPYAFAVGLTCGGILEVFVERVDESGEVGIVMEDGAVKGAPLPESPEPAPRIRTPSTRC